MSALRRPCLGCGQLVRGVSRCPDCATATAARRPPKPTRTGYGWHELKRRQSVVATWRAEHGDWCPGWQRPAHRAIDLTADHVLAVAAGGRQDGPLTVLCRSCNSAKGAKP